MEFCCYCGHQSTEHSILGQECPFFETLHGEATQTG